MIIPIILFWMIIAGSWRPSVIWREMRQAPFIYIIVAVVLTADFLFRHYIAG